MNFLKMTLQERKKLYLKALHAYHNKQTSILTDPEFDKLEDLIRKDDPDWQQLNRTGVRTGDRKAETRLNQYMPSLDKAYPEELPKFLKRIDPATLIEMDKLDGTSLQLRVKNWKPAQLCTRGDGTLGRDISHFIPALIDAGCIPGEVAHDGVLDLRIEAVMRKKTFQKNWSVEALGEKEGFDNSRQLVNGVFLRKVPGKELEDIDLVVLGIYGSTIHQGLIDAKKLDFATVWWKPDAFPADNPAYLEDVLSERKQKSPYEIDGLVITDDNFVLEYQDADKPKRIFAFKQNLDADAYEVRVNDIEYAKTRLGRISIVALITPTRMDGVVVERVTVHNAAWMKEQGVGPGAKIKVLRSGGVIPKIVGVIEPGRIKEPPFPYRQEGRFYVIDSTGEDKEVTVRAIRFFMTTLGIDMLAEKTIEKLYDLGFDSIEAYVSVAADRVSATYSHANWKKFVEAGVGENQSVKLMDELQRVLTGRILLKKLMVASGCFEAGIGERKLSQLEDAGISMRELGNMQPAEIESRLASVKGWSDKTIPVLVEGIVKFRKWYRPLKEVLKFDLDGSIPKKRTTGLLSGKSFSWTGYRNAEQETRILANGGNIVSFGGRTDVLFYSEEGKRSTKVEKAGDRAMLWSDFVKAYELS
jgi:DNA ligase (NAD+)